MAGIKRYHKVKTVTVAPTITAGAYSANDVIGGLLTLTFTDTAASLYIDSVIVVDDDDEKAAITLYVFDAAPTAIADNAAFAPLIADLKKLRTVIDVAATDYATLNSNAFAEVNQLARPIQTDDGKVYAYAVVTATPTYTATTDLTFAITALVD